MVNEKYISVQKHPTENLFIYNYTHKAQFDQIWNNETLQCRGLIMDDKFNIVSRPFPKFFNLEETKQIPSEPFEVFEKYDGSLGISYWIGSTPHIATRGSFTSEQAIKATEMLQNKYANNSSLVLNNKWTHLFEVIYPENRIVVDYKGMEDLVLLTVINTETSKELPYKKITDLYSDFFPIAKRYDGVKDLNTIKTMFSDNNSEGFVIRFKSGTRIKVKFDEYKRLHRLVTGINARHIWELLKESKPLDELLEHVPDEFYQWVKKTATRLTKQHNKIESECGIILERLKKLPTRKKQALLIHENRKYRKLSGILFKMLDNAPYDELIWKTLKPVHETPFKKEL